MSAKDDLISAYRTQGETFTYYIIALCVASIGFSISLTMDRHFTWHDLPFSLCVALLDFKRAHFGLRHLKYVGSSMYANINMLDMVDGIHPDTGRHPQKIEIGVNTITKILKDNARTVDRLSKWQGRLAYFGFFSFILWRIIAIIFIV